MLDVCLLGTGGMMPLPRRWLTALMTRYNGHSLLIDCGEGTQVAIKEKGWSFKPVDVICFTHYHGDHISGLPGLLLTMGNAERTEPLTLIGPKGLERVVNALRVIAPELPFEIKFIEITKPEEVLELNGYRITAFRVNHNVTCYGYTLEILRQGKFSPDSASAHEIPLKFWNPLQKGNVIEADGVTYVCSYVELGNPGIPHAVVPYAGLRQADENELRELGRAIRWNKVFPKGANVNFYEITGEDLIFERTFERGVEDFTYACGTGTGSVVTVLTLQGKVSGHGVQVDMTGGRLVIDAERVHSHIASLYLTGPTNVVCRGEVTDEDLIIM